MEYLLANTIARITRPHPPKIALVTGEEPMDPQLRMMYERQGQRIPDPYTQIVELLRQEKYDVEKVKLSAQEPMPEDCDALVVVAPVSLDDRQKWEIGRALAEGRPTLLALQRFTWNYRQERQGMAVTAQEADPGLDDLLAANGVTLSKQVLMDANSRALGIGGMYLSLPMHVFVTHDSMNKDSELTRRLGGVLYLWGSSLETDGAKLSAAELKRTVLLSSSDRAWLISPPVKGLTRHDIDPDGKDLKPRLLSVMLEGQFKDPQDGKPRPKWTPKIEMGPDGRPIPAMPDKPEAPARPAKGKLILAGCGRMWQDGLIGTPSIGNTAFLLNCVDALTLNESLLQVRAKQPTDRSFEKPSDTTAIWWTLTTLLVVPILVIFAGLGIWMMRVRRRDRWNAAHGRWQS
jgi:ABC-2 type transport system permease protein